MLQHLHTGISKCAFLFFVFLLYFVFFQYLKCIRYTVYYLLSVIWYVQKTYYNPRKQKKMNMFCTHYLALTYLLFSGSRLIIILPVKAIFRLDTTTIVKTSTTAVQHLVGRLTVNWSFANLIIIICPHQKGLAFENVYLQISFNSLPEKFI